MILPLLLYVIWRPFIIPRFAEIWGRTSLSGSARALYRALVRPEGSAFFSEYGEPTKLCQSKSATTSSARFNAPLRRINRLRSALKPGQDFCQASCQKTCPYGHKETDCCHDASASSSIMSTILPSITSPPSARMCKEKRSGDFRLFPPANFANSAILPTAKISAFFMQNFLLQKPKDSSLLCP